MTTQDVASNNKEDAVSKLTKDELMDKVDDLINDHFPKGRCSERGVAIVLVAMILSYLMEQGLVEQPYDPNQ